MNIKFVIIISTFFLYLNVATFSYASVDWPVKPQSVQEIFHVYNNTHLQLGVKSSGNIYSIASGVVSFVKKNKENMNVVEIISNNNMRIGYIGITSNVFVGQQIDEQEIIGIAPSRGPWYVRMFDEVIQVWVDPLQVLPPTKLKNTFKVRLIDFEFVYKNRNLDGSISKDTRASTTYVREIQRKMFTGVFRPRITIDIQENNSNNQENNSILQEYLFVKIGNREFNYTRKDIFRMAKDKKNDTITIKNNKIYFLLPEMSLIRGYHNIQIIARGPLNIQKKFVFSILIQ